MHESKDMIKTEAGQTWSDRVNFTLRKRFSRTCKVLKLMSFRGLRPCTPARGPKNFHLLKGGHVFEVFCWKLPAP